ncbi:hypothetical protein N7492_005795 [Penicillium capsulatum]|uniref:C2H2-type domain-containing protein n=1 Tax=Penicillium capsulatum TaxID=69766 RepID=A0A9W9LRG9_9EURO|nr:hypothetical protein N7492_005795 [Penicillium capsulatum]KAJ6135105.1 hypothetical protein N7512_000265 [Penicillium capsulatum]
MSSGEFSSQPLSSHHRNSTKVPASPEVGFVSTLIDPVQTSALHSSTFPTPASWSYSPAASEIDASTPSFSNPAHSQQSTPVDSTSRVPDSYLDSPSVPPSFENPSKEQPRGLGITSYPMSVASDAYFPGPMQPNSHQYVWANRPFQPLQPPSGPMSQQFPPPSSYPSGFPVGYNGHPSGPMHSYHHEHPAPPSYLPQAPGSAGRQSHSRSPPMARPFPPHSAALSEQPLMTSSPPYMMSQPAYYLPEAPPIPSSHHSSMSSQASSLITEPVFSPSESVPADNEHQVRVMSSRPRPQCWDHGCNGREFSTFSNLLRHQREKSGVVAKAECPICGAVFTRTTARNIHVAQGKCKGTGRESSTE